MHVHGDGEALVNHEAHFSWKIKKSERLGLDLTFGVVQRISVVPGATFAVLGA